MNKDTDVKAFNLAKKFLLENTPDEVDEKLLDHYLKPLNVAGKNIKLRDLYFRSLSSAQNANMKAGVIGKSIGGVDKLSKVLFSFDPKTVTKHYGNDSEKVFNAIVSELKPTGKIRQSPMSIWPKYCRTILSAADFFSQFESESEFYDWANYFYKDEKSFAALPMVLGEEIYGIAFPLACDFLKELGFVNFGKPDVHIKQIFEAIGLTKPKASNYQVLRAMCRVAKNVGETPYNVDKLFWLVGSGYFYDHPNIGKKGRVGRKKEMFIKYWQDRSS